MVAWRVTGSRPLHACSADARTSHSPAFNGRQPVLKDRLERVETYLQPPVEDPGSPHGYINCHNTFATSTDGDFQLTKAWPQAKQRAKAIVQQSQRLEAAKP
jgi:pectin methylesterase-like acyl-CoA thioesterase